MATGSSESPTGSLEGYESEETRSGGETQRRFGEKIEGRSRILWSRIRAAALRCEDAPGELLADKGAGLCLDPTAFTL